MSLNNICNLIKKEYLFNLRNKRFLILFLSIILLIALSIVMYSQSSALGGYNLNTLLMQNYNIIIQILALALIPILSSCISAEQESGTWIFYRMKGIKKSEIVLSKIIFYNFIIILFILISIIIETFIMKMFFNLKLEFNLDMNSIVYLVILLTVMISLIINTEIFVSGLSKKTVNAAIYIIILWLSLMILNGVLPLDLGKGYVAPFTQNSIQTSVIWRLLQNGQISPIPFETCLYLPTTNELVIALLIPALLNVFVIISSLIITREGKS